MDIETITREFQGKAVVYSQLKEEALFILEQALNETDIKLHSITSRVKALDSFIGKVQRKQSDKPFEEIQDVVGLRVICLFISDIARIGAVIRKSFFVLSEDNKVEGTDISSFGYMSVHFVLMMKDEYKGPRYDSIAKTPFEIQVRTIAMDSWANVSHYLDYKSDVDVPKELRRDFYALSGLFYVADRHFEMFMESSRKSREKMVRAFGKDEPPLDQEINSDSLAAYLINEFPDRARSDAKSISDLIGELSDAGIKSISDIDRAKDAAWEAFLAWERDSPPHGEATSQFTDVGVVRGILDLTNENYQRLRGIRKETILKYETLLKK